DERARFGGLFHAWVLGIGGPHQAGVLKPQLTTVTIAAAQGGQLRWPPLRDGPGWVGWSMLALATGRRHGRQAYSANTERRATSRLRSRSASFGVPTRPSTRRNSCSSRPRAWAAPAWPPTATPNRVARPSS